MLQITKLNIKMHSSRHPSQWNLVCFITTTEVYHIKRDHVILPVFTRGFSKSTSATPNQLHFVQSSNPQHPNPSSNPEPVWCMMGIKQHRHPFTHPPHLNPKQLLRFSSKRSVVRDGACSSSSSVPFLILIHCLLNAIACFVIALDNCG